VLGGARPASLTLLLGAFSAFAFAREIPGFCHQGGYYRVLDEGMVRGSIAVLHSRHDTAVGTLYSALSLNGEGGRGLGRRGYASTIVAASALGAVGARGVGAPEVELREAMVVGLPRYAIVNVDGSNIVNARASMLGAHGDIHRPEIAGLVLLAARLLEAGPDGLRPRRVDPLVHA